MMVEDCLHHAYLAKECCDVQVPNIVIGINAYYYLLTSFYPGGEEHPEVVPKLLSRVWLVGVVGVLSGEVLPVLLGHQKMSIIGF